MAGKVADHLMKDRNALIVKHGNHRSMAASSVLEPICLLYVRSGEKKYLDFAEEIVRQWNVGFMGTNIRIIRSIIVYELFK